MGLAVNTGRSSQIFAGTVIEEVRKIQYANGATLNDLNIGDALVLELISPQGVAGTVTLNGVVSNSGDSRPLKILSTGGGTVTIVGAAAGSFAANRFDASVALTLVDGTGAEFQWNATENAWLATGSAPGAGADPIFTAIAAGDVPASGGGVVNFLRADTTWSAPGSSANPFFGGSNLVTPPVAANWTWAANQGGGSFSTLANGTFNIIYPAQGALAGVNWPALVANNTVSAATFTLTTCLALAGGLANGGASPQGGIYWRDNIGGTFGVWVLDLRATANRMTEGTFVALGNEVAHFGPAVPIGIDVQLGYIPIWIRIQRLVGGNVLCSISFDGLGWTLVFTDANNVVVAPNELGIVLINDGAVAAANTDFLNLYSWQVGP